MQYYPTNGFAPAPPYADPRRQLRKRLRREANRPAWGILLMIIGMSVFLYLFEIIGDVLGLYSVQNSEAIEQIFNCLYYVLGAFLPFFIMFNVLKRDWNVNELVPFQRVSFSKGLWIIVLGFGVCMVSNIPANVVAAFCEQIGLNGSLPESPSPQTLPGTVFYIIQIAVIPPLVEEFAFRGIALSRLRRFGDGFAVFATAFLFALFHGNVIQFVFTFLVGLYFGFAMVKTNNLLIPILLHAINNGVSVLLELMIRTYGETFGNNLYLLIFAGAVFAAIIALIVLLITKKEMFRFNPNPVPMGFGQKVGAFLTNPGVIALFLYSCYSSVLFLIVDFSQLGY